MQQKRQFFDKNKLYINTGIIGKMDKFLITAFRPEIANAILNSQDKLNPDGDAYISKEELPAVLDFFGETKIENLLKSDYKNSGNSIFTQKEKEDKPDENKNIDVAEFNEFMNSDNKVLNNDGSAAYELQNSVASDIMTSSLGTPYEAQMKSLYEEKKALLKRNADTSAVEAKILALNEAVKDYIELHQQEVTQALAENGLVKNFKYGKNGEKTGYYIQTFSVKANNTMNNNNSNDTVEDSGNSDENAENSVETNNNTDNNKAVGGITYNIEVVTDKFHGIGHIDADSENSDITAVGVYSNELKNGARLNFSGNVRQTIEKDNNRTNIGASFDYAHKNFSAGGYGVYENEEIDGSKTTTTSVQGYAKYGKSFRGAIGYARESFSGSVDTVKYVSAKVSGKKDVNENIALTGSVEGLYGIASEGASEGEKAEKSSIVNVNAGGGISFKSNSSDLSANLLANVNVDREKTIYGEYGTTVTSTVLGNVSNDKIDVTATLTNMNSPALAYNSDKQDFSNTRETNWSSSITVGLKKLFGRNVIPSFTYNLNCGDKVKHNVAVNLGINF